MRAEQTIPTRLPVSRGSSRKAAVTGGTILRCIGARTTRSNMSNDGLRTIRVKEGWAARTMRDHRSADRGFSLCMHREEGLGVGR